MSGNGYDPERFNESRNIGEPQLNAMGRPFAAGIRDTRQLDPNQPVAAEVAVKNAQLAMAFGYLCGIGVGVGLGAIIAGLGVRFARKKN